MLANAHYRDRLRETVFAGPEGSGYYSLFSSFEGGSFIPWRWGSLVSTARSLKRRAAPLRVLWSLDKYLHHAASGEENIKTKTETLKLFDAAVRDKFFWHYLEP